MIFTPFGIPGERLLVELRNRLSLPMLDPVGAGVGGSGGGSVVGDVREALAGLGYAPDEPVLVSNLAALEARRLAASSTAATVK